MSRALCIFLLAVTLGGGVQSKYKNKRSRFSIGGHVVQDKEAGWQVAILHKKRLICDGTIVQKEFVLTAAECVDGIELNELRVRANTKTFKKDGQMRKVREILQHPEYNRDTLAYDVALLHLMRPINMESSRSIVRSVNLPDESTDLPSSIKLYGWGASNRFNNYTMTRNLRSSLEKVYSTTKCKQFLPDAELSDMFFCTRNRAKEVDICNDDLGGPAIADNDVQVGIVVRSSECSKELQPTICIKLSTVNDWISETVKSNRN